MNDFHEGFAKVQSNEKAGFIDGTGREVIPLKYSMVSDFKNGIAGVAIGSLWGYINKTGRLVIPIKYGFSSFSEGIFLLKHNGKWGIFDETGKPL